MILRKPESKAPVCACGCLVGEFFTTRAQLRLGLAVRKLQRVRNGTLEAETLILVIFINVHSLSLSLHREEKKRVVRVFAPLKKTKRLQDS